MTLLEARKLIPSQFRLANNTINVLIKEEGKEFGYFNSVTNTITIFLKVYDDVEYVAINKNQLKHTFYHEVFHCFNYYFNTEMGEGLAQTFAGFMCEYEETQQFV